MISQVKSFILSKVLFLLLFSFFVSCGDHVVRLTPPNFFIDPICQPEDVSQLFSCDSYREENLGNAPVPSDGTVAGDNRYKDEIILITDKLQEPEECTNFKFGEGTFLFDTGFSISVNGVIIEGAGVDKTTLDFAPRGIRNGSLATDGIGANSIENFVVKDFTIKNASKNNIRVQNSKKILFQNINSTWDIQGGMPGSDVYNGDYALYPVYSKYVVLDNVEVSNAKDAGLYVGQSAYAVIRDSYAHHNVAGIEVENTCYIDTFSNEATDNTGGILVFDHPGNLIVGTDSRFAYNIIEDNNLRNFCNVGTVCDIPAGTGFIFIATRRVVMEYNRFGNHASFDVAVINGIANENDYVLETINGIYSTYDITLRNNEFTAPSGYDLNNYFTNFHEKGSGYMNDFENHATFVDYYERRNYRVEECEDVVVNPNDNDPYDDAFAENCRNEQEKKAGSSLAEIGDDICSEDDSDCKLKAQIDDAFKKDLERKELAAVAYILLDIVSAGSAGSAGSEEENVDKLPNYLPNYDPRQSVTTRLDNIVSDGITATELSNTDNVNGINLCLLSGDQANFVTEGAPSITVKKNDGEMPVEYETILPSILDMNLPFLVENFIAIFDEFDTGSPNFSVIATHASVISEGIELIDPSNLPIEADSSKPYDDYSCEGFSPEITGVIDIVNAAFPEDEFPSLARVQYPSQYPVKK